MQPTKTHSDLEEISEKKDMIQTLYRTLKDIGIQRRFSLSENLADVSKIGRLQLIKAKQPIK
jgi:hypothetical protein